MKQAGPSGGLVRAIRSDRRNVFATVLVCLLPVFIVALNLVHLLAGDDGLNEFDASHGVFVRRYLAAFISVVFLFGGVIALCEYGGEISNYQG
jgi:amino acid transporter